MRWDGSKDNLGWGMFSIGTEISPIFRICCLSRMSSFIRSTKSSFYSHLSAGPASCLPRVAPFVLRPNHTSDNEGWSLCPNVVSHWPSDQITIINSLHTHFFSIPSFLLYSMLIIFLYIQIQAWFLTLFPLFLLFVEWQVSFYKPNPCSITKIIA